MSVREANMQDKFHSKFQKVGRCFALMALLIAMAGCSKGVKPEDINYTGDSVADFVKAIEVGDITTVERLAASDPSLLDLQDEEGKTAMHYAALGNQPGVIRVLADKGMDVNITDFEGRTPLTVLEDSGFRYEDARDTLKKLGGTN